MGGGDRYHVLTRNGGLHRGLVILTLFGLGFFGVPGPGWAPKVPLHKSESIDAVDMKLGG